MCSSGHVYGFVKPITAKDHWWKHFTKGKGNYFNCIIAHDAVLVCTSIGHYGGPVSRHAAAQRLAMSTHVFFTTTTDYFHHGSRKKTPWSSNKYWGSAPHQHHFTVRSWYQQHQYNSKIEGVCAYVHTQYCIILCIGLYLYLNQEEIKLQHFLTIIINSWILNLHSSTTLKT